MHVAACLSSPATRPTTRSCASGHRLHLVPRYRQRLATCPSTRAGRCGSTTRISTSPITSATRRCPPRLRPAQAPRRAVYSLAPTAPTRCGRSGSSRDSPRAGSPSCPRPITRSWTGSPASTSPRSCSIRPRTPMPVAPPDHDWIPRPLPTGAQLLADALLERATVPAEIARGIRATLRGPRHVAGHLGRAGSRHRARDPSPDQFGRGAGRCRG